MVYRVPQAVDASVTSTFTEDCPAGQPLADAPPTFRTQHRIDQIGWLRGLICQLSSGLGPDARVSRACVVPGPFYVVVVLVLVLTRTDFDLTRYALSLLTLGEHGWMQRANLLPDPSSGSPPGQVGDTMSTGGILHLVWGALGFGCLAVAAFAYARWGSGRKDGPQMHLGAWCGSVVLIGVIGGAALASLPAGVALLWLAVLAGWLWLALASARLYTLVPHPVIAERNEAHDAR